LFITEQGHLPSPDCFVQGNAIIPTSPSIQSAPISQPVTQPSSGYQGLVSPNLDSIKQAVASIQTGINSLKEKEKENDKFSPTNSALFPNITASLAERSRTPSPEFKQGIEEYERIAKDKQQNAIQMANAQAGYKTTGTTPVAQGRAAVVAQTGAAQQSAMTAAQEAALRKAGLGQSQQTLEQNALSQAGNLAAPQLGAIGSQQFYSPVQGGQAGGQFNPETVARQYAQEVAQGTRAYDDAVQAMGLYGNAGKQFLDNAIRGGGAFNFAQAQALSGVQGQVSPALNMAQAAIANLQTTLQTIPYLQRTSIPLINSLTNVAAAVGIGTGTATEKANAINEARTQVANALGVMNNTTPTAFTSMVEDWFPSNATPEQIDAGIRQFNSLAQSRQGIFGAPGQVQPFNPTPYASSNKQYDW